QVVGSYIVFKAEDGIRDFHVTGVQTCALPISMSKDSPPVIEIRPQPGPQEAFLATSADIAFYGGAAGSGKSFATILDPLRHVHISEERRVGIYGRSPWSPTRK